MMTETTGVSGDVGRAAALEVGDADAIAILLRVFDEFFGVVRGLDLLPEVGNASGVGSGGCAIATAEVADDVVEDDEASGTHEGAVVIEVGLDAGVGVVSVDEEQVER